jgi:hypothetical protein
MNPFPAASARTDDADSAWAKTKNYFKQTRPLQQICKVVVVGSVELVFRRFDTPQLVVAGETEEAVESLETRYKGDTLYLQRKGADVTVTTNMRNGTTVCFGNGNIHISGNNIHISTGSGSLSISQGKVVVGLAMPIAPDVAVQGSGDATLWDLLQDTIELEVTGSGDIKAHGSVDMLEAEVTGSGDIDATELLSDRARLSIAGSGDIEAHVRRSVKAKVAGSGDIRVYGNPDKRDTKVAGSGSIKFR